MTEPTFHTVSWAPSAIKDAVEHASAAFKVAEGGYARVSSFELSALIDAARALIEHNEREETNLKPEPPQVSMEELKERIGAVVDDYTAGEDYGSGPTRYYLTVGTPDEMTEHVAAGLFSGMEFLFRAVADWQALWDEKEEWEKAAKEAWERETALTAERDAACAELATVRGAAAPADDTPLRERIAAAFVELDTRDWGGDHGFTTYGNDTESDAFVDAAYGLVAGEMDRLVGVVIERGAVIRQLTWLHAEAMWHAQHHRAQAAADLQRIAVAMHLKPTADADSIVHWAENHVDSIRDLALERDKVWEVLLPLLEQGPLSKDDVQDDELRERRRAGRLAELAADVLRWQTDEIERLRERVHEVVDETQRRFAPYQSRCDRFDVWSKWAREMYERVGGRWGSESEATRLVVQSLLKERDEALAALEKQQALLAEAVVIPDDARTEIRNAISNPAGQKLKREQVGDQRETVASWGARAVLKLMESWRAEATRVEEVGAVVEAGYSCETARESIDIEDLLDEMCQREGCGHRRGRHPLNGECVGGWAGDACSCTGFEEGHRG